MPRQEKRQKSNLWPVQVYSRLTNLNFNVVKHSLVFIVAHDQPISDIIDLSFDDVWGKVWNSAAGRFFKRKKEIACKLNMAYVIPFFASPVSFYALNFIIVMTSTYCNYFSVWGKEYTTPFWQGGIFSLSRVARPKHWTIHGWKKQDRILTTRAFKSRFFPFGCEKEVD